MNIAIFASAFHPSLGGVEELVRQLAHAYGDKGVSAIVLTNRWPRSLSAFENYEGIPVYRLAMRVPDGSAKAHISYGLTHEAICREMLDILRKHETTHLHVQCVSSNAFYALIAQRKLRLPLVVSAQGELNMDACGLYQRSAFARGVLRDALDNASAVTACSAQTLGEIEQFHGRPFFGRRAVIYNGIRMKDFARYEPVLRPRPFVLAVGRHVPQKGFDVLIRAFAKVVHDGGTSHDLLMAGDGPERRQLEAIAQESGIAPYVHFVGRLDRKDAVAHFLSCSFFVLPSRHEPMGIVNLEAMAAKKAVIASNVGGVPELVQDGRTCLLVAPEDPGALAEAVRRLIDDPDLRGRMGEAGYQRALGFDWPIVAEQYLEVYRHATRSVNCAKAESFEK